MPYKDHATNAEALNKFRLQLGMMKISLHSEEALSHFVRLHLKNPWHGLDGYSGDSKRNKKE